MSQSAKDRILAALVPDEIVDLAKALVRIPSYTTEETPVARFLDELFRREGLESRLQEVDPGRFQALARLPGAGGGQSLMLTGTSTSTRSPAAGCAIPGRRLSRATGSTGPGSST